MKKGKGERQRVSELTGSQRTEKLAKRLAFGNIFFDLEFPLNLGRCYNVE